MTIGSRNKQSFFEDIDVKNASFRRLEALGAKEKRLCYYKQQEMSESTKPAMEFLSRPWSPSASDFLQILPSQKTLWPGVNEKEDVDFRRNYSSHSHNDEMDFSDPRTWIKGNTLTRLLRSRKEKKKEETRLQTAELHAALSLTQLAAAIAGISSNMSSPQNSPSQNKNYGGEWEQDMSNLLSNSAALITSACAEAAESLGANREQVREAINSGMAIQSPIDMMSVTAMTATCLRGASLLRERAMAETQARSRQVLELGAQICIIMPSGRKECSRVSVYLKHDNLVLNFKKKYFGGALTSAKEYKVTNIMEERMERDDSSFLCLKTKDGVIKLSFEDEMQSRIWISTILNLLEMRNPYGQPSRTLSFSGIK